ncbi:MAG: Flp pilus assembly protein CpaB [Desulfobaccales bacterium]
MKPGLKYFIFAAVLGLVAVFLVHSYIKGRVGEPRLTATKQVVVAEADIAPGTAVSAGMVRVADYPDNLAPAQAINDPKKVVNRVALVNIAKGEPILEDKLAPEGTRAGLGGLLGENKLAVTVKTDEVTGVAGFINPGDRVDVMVEMQEPGEGGEHFSKIILQNLKVLSTGQVWEQSKGKERPDVVPTVTLEVTPEQAETLNLASLQGRIRLALRNQLNRGYFNTAGVITSQLAYKRPFLPVAPKPENGVPQKAPSRTVKIIKGMNVTSQDY